MLDRFASLGLAAEGQQVAANVTTMHSLALKLLASANLLAGMYPAPPVILDHWRQENIFDVEFAHTAGITPARARQVRTAYDAHWQTLRALNLVGGIAPPTPSEQASFTSYYPTAKSLYSCLLPGEVVRSCVDEMNQGSITSTHLPPIEHLIVDEYQDLNNCDQNFVDHLERFGASIFIAGDDDQSIYSFRHAAPNGIVGYLSTHPGAASHNLQHCFRCATSILAAAQSLIAHNTGRIPKAHRSMYQNSTPSVSGGFHVWRCPTGVEEAKWIAESSRDLISAGVQPNQIFVLLRSNRTQGTLLYDAFSAAGVLFEPVRADILLEEPMPRLTHSLLKVIKNPTNHYVPYRVILGQLYGVGDGTCTEIASRTVSANLNFRDLFYSPLLPGVFTPRQAKAITRVASVIQAINGWTPNDTLSSKAAAIDQIGNTVFNRASQPGGAALTGWANLMNSLPGGMTLDELYGYLESDTEAGRFQILDSVARRLGMTGAMPQNPATSRIRVLTMHGAKGLEGQVVFIPGVEQGITPSGHSISAPGLVNEERRLLYMAITRSKADCIVSFAQIRTGSQSYLLSGSGVTNQNRSQFIPEIGASVTQRTSGLTTSEIASIVADISGL